MPMTDLATAGGAAETRRRLIQAADDLFYREGIHATGVDAVARRAGVTKMTLYSHFGSKDELVAAYLKERDRRWRCKLEETLKVYSAPREKLLAVFEAYVECLVADGLRGCAYVNCAAEFPDPEHPARRVVKEHKAGVRERLRSLAEEAGAKEPEDLAERLFVVLEGAFITGALEGDEGILERVRPVVEDLLDAAVR